MVTRPLLAALGNLDSPGRYLHWSIFTVSEANLVLIAVMVVIFGAALLIPFPGHTRKAGSAPGRTPLTATRRRRAAPGADRRPTTSGTTPTPPCGPRASGAGALRLLPPGKLLPDRQPAYVASWVYVFGVATLAALGLAIVSGFAIALGGTDWWHTDSVGHFFNSLHLWSVEAFMAFMVIHLWGKFWMAAWRGRRALTWVTGVVAFVASVVECFTGYLSQQNFDSQWISTSGKDAFNAVGVGAFFNLMNVGQMLLWHVVLIPVVLVALVGAHVLAVRVRGVVHPLPARRARGRAARRAAAVADAADWRGPTRRYDIVKEASVATLVALVLVVALAGLLSSPDVPPVTVASWAQVAPADFVATAASELAGTSETATYGPPYNHALRQHPAHPLLAADHRRGAPAHRRRPDLRVVAAVARSPPPIPTLAAALDRYQRASSSTQAAWNTAYAKAVTHVTFRNGTPVVPAAADGPMPDHAGHRGHPGPQRRHRRRPPGQPRLLRHQLHQAAAVPRGRPVLLQHRHRPAPQRRPVGRHERDRQLPGPALAVALRPCGTRCSLSTIPPMSISSPSTSPAPPPSFSWPSPSFRDFETSPASFPSTASSGATGTDAATPKRDLGPPAHPPHRSPTSSLGANGLPVGILPTHRHTLGTVLRSTPDLKPDRTDSEREHAKARLHLGHAPLERPLRLRAGTQDGDGAAVSAGPVDLPAHRTQPRRRLDHPRGVHTHERRVEGPLRLGVGDHRLAEGAQIPGDHGPARRDGGLAQAPEHRRTRSHVLDDPAMDLRGVVGPTQKDQRQAGAEPFPHPQAVHGGLRVRLDLQVVDPAEGRAQLVLNPALGTDEVHLEAMGRIGDGAW